LGHNPTFRSNSSDEPAYGVLQFIETIESADPNSGGFEEDDLGVSWGHNQFRGWRDQLSSWQAIGTPDTAYRLIASILQTCSVARELCKKEEAARRKNDQDALRYLSDSYLQEITEHLWHLWTTAGGVSTQLTHIIP
jgi:hypothetical protein